MHKTDGLVKLKFIFSKLIIIMWCQRVVICTKCNQAWTWKQSPPLQHNTMRCITGKVCQVVVKNVQVLAYLVRNRTETKHTCVQKCFFMLTDYYHTVRCMEYVHMREKNIPCVIGSQKYIKIKNYTKKEFLKQIHPLHNYMRSYTFYQYRSYNFNSHMYASQATTTVTKTPRGVQTPRPISIYYM